MIKFIFLIPHIIQSLFCRNNFIIKNIIGTIGRVIWHGIAKKLIWRIFIGPSIAIEGICKVQIFRFFFRFSTLEKVKVLLTSHTFHIMRHLRLGSHLITYLHSKRESAWNTHPHTNTHTQTHTHPNKHIHIHPHTNTPTHKYTHIH